MAGHTGCWSGAASNKNRSMPITGFMLVLHKPRWEHWFVLPDNAGRSSRLFRQPKENAAWITTRFAAGMAGIATSHLPCWPLPHWLRCDPEEKKTPAGQVPLSVPELRHLLAHLFWRGWHGVEHLLRWSTWRRKHQFHALRYHYQKRGSPLPILYLQL